MLIHQPRTQGTQGQVSDLEIEANEIERMRRLMENMTLNNATRVHPRLSIESAAIDTETDKPTNRSMKKAIH